MKILIYSLIVVIGVCFGYLLRSQSGQKPHVPSKKMTTAELNVRKFDFGVMQLKDTANGEFIIKNIGSEPLLIKFIQTDCGCTVVAWEDKPIPSGQESKIKVQITPLEVGYFSKKMTVFCNDKRSPFYLSIKGEVKDK